jgi:flagellar basal body-associated protein FliL
LIILIVVVVVLVVAILLAVLKPWASTDTVDPNAATAEGESQGLVVQDEVVVDVNIPDDEQPTEEPEEE